MSQVKQETRHLYVILLLLPQIGDKNKILFAGKPEQSQIHSVFVSPAARNRALRQRVGVRSVAGGLSALDSSVSRTERSFVCSLATRNCAFLISLCLNTSSAQTDRQTDRQTHAHARTHTHTYTRTHAHAHARTHMHTHERTHTHEYTSRKFILRINIAL